MKLKLLGLSVVLSLCLASVAFAGQAINTAPTKAAPSAAAIAVSNNVLAGQLANYARQAKSPLALAAAAQILANSALPDTQRAKTDDSGKAMPTASGVKAPTAQDLYAEAIAMAKGQQNAALADLIDKQAKASGQTKGRVAGALQHVDVVNAGTRDVYRMKFRGGETAIVAAKAGNGEDIDLLIYDENGNEVERDRSTDDVPVCIWTPKWTGEFTIKVDNQARNDVTYVLMTN